MTDVYETIVHRAGSHLSPEDAAENAAAELRRLGRPLPAGPVRVIYPVENHPSGTRRIRYTVEEDKSWPPAGLEHKRG